MNAQNTLYRAALYMRLSKDDESGGESSSITNQRNLLTAYAGEHGYPVVSEYVDDGYSGTNFHRPAFQRMLADIQAQKINLILTKDLSRLGRDYIQTGQFTEIYFPSKKVRYIAVNDGFDSENQCTDIAPFKHVVNEMYARDASKKIRSAFSVKMRSGSFIGNFAPYGYRKDPNDKNHLLPDEASAQVVRTIFALAAEGEKPAAIARYLNDRGTLTPALYRCCQHPQLHADDSCKRREWTAAAVTRLLGNIVYLGHMAQGKTTKVSFKSRLTLRNARQDWIVVENTHEPVVSAALFELAQKRIKSRTCQQKGRFHNLFSGLAKCGACGRNMSAVGTRRKGSPANLACGGYKLYGGGACSNHFIDYNALYRIVLDAVQEQTKLTQAERDALYRELCAELEAQPGPAEAKSKAALLAENEKLDGIIGQLYDDKQSGKLSAERFYKLLQKYEKQGEALRRKIEALDLADGKEQEAQKKEADAVRLARLLDRYTEIRELDANLLFHLVERIEIGQGRYEKTEHGRVKRQDVRIDFRFLTEPQTKEAAFF